MVLPPRAPGQMHPIPPGTVRGIWRTRGLTGKDKGKRLTIEGDKFIKVDGQMRSVDWPRQVPDAVTDAVVEHVTTDLGGYQAARRTENRHRRAVAGVLGWE